MIVLCDPDQSLRDRVLDLLGEAEPSAQASTLTQALGQIRAAATPTVLLVGPGVPLGEVMNVARGADRDGLAARVVLLVEELDPGVLRDALRAGVADVVLTDADAQEIRDAVTRAFQEIRGTGAAGSAGEGTGRIVTVFSTKGGCGKSLVASNLAILLAQETGEEVALVDLDLQSGDLAIMLQVMPALSIYDAAQNIDRMDAGALRGYMTPHQSGISLLAAPLEPSLSEAVRPDSIARLLELLRSIFPYVVIDGPAFFTDQILAALDLTDSLVLVGSLDVPAVKNLRMALSTLHQLGHNRDQILTVLNRADSNVGLRIPEVEKSLGTPIDVRIPSSRDVPLSVNQGSPLRNDRRHPRLRAHRAAPARPHRHGSDVQRPDEVYIERDGKLDLTDVTFLDEGHLRGRSRRSSGRSAAASTRRARTSTPACPTAPGSTPSSRRCRSTVRC
jgi:pilus assembly protein CpaE